MQVFLIILMVSAVGVVVYYLFFSSKSKGSLEPQSHNNSQGSVHQELAMLKETTGKAELNYSLLQKELEAERKTKTALEEEYATLKLTFDKQKSECDLFKIENASLKGKLVERDRDAKKIVDELKVLREKVQSGNDSQKQTSASSPTPKETVKPTTFIPNSEIKKAIPASQNPQETSETKAKAPEKTQSAPSAKAEARQESAKVPAAAEAEVSMQTKAQEAAKQEAPSKPQEIKNAQAAQNVPSAKSEPPASAPNTEVKQESAKAITDAATITQITPEPSEKKPHTQAAVTTNAQIQKKKLMDEPAVSTPALKTEKTEEPITNPKAFKLVGEDDNDDQGEKDQDLQDQK